MNIKNTQAWEGIQISKRKIVLKYKINSKHTFKFNIHGYNWHGEQQKSWKFNIYEMKLENGVNQQKCP